MKIPFENNRCSIKSNEYVAECLEAQISPGNGIYCSKIITKFDNYFNNKSEIFLTGSGTQALEMACLLTDIKLGDEIIAPAYTFVSSVLPFANMGARIKFCDVNPISLSMDLECLESMITPNTKVVVSVNYGGSNPHIEDLKNFCDNNQIFHIEDAAQSIGAFNETGKPYGSFGDAAVYSFHATKNITSAGEGGCCIINRNDLSNRAHILQEKGTDRRLFQEGLVDKYTWRDFGGSYLLPDVCAAYLLGQLEDLDEITQKRVTIWNRYAEVLGSSHIITKGMAKLSSAGESNGHLFGLFFENKKIADRAMHRLRKKGIDSRTHYQALHLSPFYKDNYHARPLPVSERASQSFVRLPFGFDDLSKIEKITEELEHL